MADRRSDDHPLTGFRFGVEIKGIVQAAFSSVSGLTIETAVVPMEQGGNNEYVHQLKGQTKYTNIVLKRGMTTSQEFFDWVQNSVTQETSGAKREDGAIIVYDDTGKKPMVRFEFVEAWPCKFVGPSFDTGSSAVLLETLELAHHGFTMKKG